MSLLSVRCKLIPHSSTAEKLLTTVNQFANACNFALGVARRDNIWNKFALQKACYTTIRERYGLTANLAIRALARVGKRKGHKAGGFKATSVDYDQRIFSINLEREEVSLSTVDGRVKVPLKIAGYQRHLLRTASSIQGGQLVKSRDGGWYIHIWCEYDDPVPGDPDGFLGVDLGINHIAVDSDGEMHDGSALEANRRRILKLRSALQSKGTKSAKRHLKKLAGYETRYRRHENHRISKTLIAKAKRTGRGLKVEDLTGIRERTRARGKANRAKHSSWAFHQLRWFLEYKALRAGVALATVDPAYTSRTCPECGCREQGNRPDQATFKCLACGYGDNADRNAARNIARADVKRPIVSWELGRQVSTSSQGQSPRL